MLGIFTSNLPSPMDAVIKASVSRGRGMERSNLSVAEGVEAELEGRGAGVRRKGPGLGGCSRHSVQATGKLLEAVPLPTALWPPASVCPQRHRSSPGLPRNLSGCHGDGTHSSQRHKSSKCQQDGCRPPAMTAEVFPTAPRLSSAPGPQESL